jgi:PQQ-like domain
MTSRILAVMLAVLTLWTSACAELGVAPIVPFQNTAPSSRETLASALARGNAPRNLKVREVALLVSDAADSVRAVRLDSGATWTFKHRIDAMLLAGDSVFVMGDEELVHLDLASGAALFRRRTGPLRLVGADASGDLSVVVLATNGGERSSVLAFDRRGSVLQQWESMARVGPPAIHGDLIWVSWRDTFVSALDPVSGQETALFQADVPATNLLSRDGTLYVGSSELLNTRSLVQGSLRAKIPALQGLAGVLPEAPYGANESGGPQEARRRMVMLSSAPPRGSELPASLSADDTHYMSYASSVLALRNADNHVRWAKALPAPVLSVAAIQGGVVACTVNGAVERFDLSGKSRALLPGSASANVSQCVVRVLAQASKARLPEPVPDDFAEFLSNENASLLPLQSALLAGLKTYAEPDVTQMLLALAANRPLARRYSEGLRDALPLAKDGRALTTFVHALTQGDRCPVSASVCGPLALAVRSLKLKECAGDLMQLLLDPETPEGDLPYLAAALETLAGSTEQPGLREFFILNNKNAKTDAMLRAVFEVAKAMRRLVSKSDYALLKNASVHPSTPPRLRELLVSELSH